MKNQIVIPIFFECLVRKKGILNKVLKIEVDFGNDQSKRRE